MSDPRTPREMRLAIREAEENLRRLQEASMMAGDWRADWSFTAARAKLRQAERHFAKKDPDPETLKPLSPRVHQRPPRGPRRQRYRCPSCFRETLLNESDLERDPMHSQLRKAGDGWERVECGEWESVPRLPKGAQQRETPE